MKKRERTQQQIRAAAMQLASQIGIDAVDVHAICTEAGVSKRTFFNHFTFKDEVFAVPPPAYPKASVERFLSGSGPLLEELVTLLQDQTQEIGEDGETAAVMHYAMRNNPRIAALQINAMHGMERELASLIADRLGRAPDDHASIVVAAAATAATRIAVDIWIDDRSTDLRDQVARSVLHLRLLNAVPEVATT
ncbi:hypothetical protein ATO8_20454 [Roseivivax marinus]|uniref:HTH tetR-type domain-containing protein n=1 Tax=Roseivivax marinus TaxID=1379903 RepID=W4HEH3_9RHOB|nr:TetR/AcrR family transcriptional regulator [Roseivivax marinus]ETW10803.1 hypothetical protein ATO8_20454 [Roseivivax marinus]